MSWVWYEPIDGDGEEDGFWHWDTSDGPQEPDRRSVDAQSRKGSVAGEKVSNDGLDRIIQRDSGQSTG